MSIEGIDNRCYYKNAKAYQDSDIYVLYQTYKIQSFPLMDKFQWYM